MTVLTISDKSCRIFVYRRDVLSFHKWVECMFSGWEQTRVIATWESFVGSNESRYGKQEAVE